MNPLRRVRHPHLLQISVRPWLTALSRAAGRPVSLARVPEESLERIRARGFHGVWLMGVWPTGASGRRIALEHAGLLADYERVLPDWEPRDVGGSPYSIAAYEASDALGGAGELARLRERLHDLGLGLVLDFVPNHLTRDHAWLDDHPGFFVRGGARALAADPSNWFVHTTSSGEDRVFAHGRDPYFSGWSDTVQVDYRRPEAREAMAGLLADLGARCDGVRCDVAMLVLDDVFHRTWSDDGCGPWTFWEEAIARTRAAHPEIVLVAEVYWGLQDRLIDAGFDFAYDKDLTDLLLAGNADGARAHTVDPSRTRTRAHFLENHDEDRALAAFGPERLRAAAAITYGLPGMRFFQEGQPEGRRVRTPIQLSRAPDEPPVAWCLEFHERLFEILSEDPFHFGTWSPLDVHAGGDGGRPPVVGSTWTLADDMRIVAGSLAGHAVRARVTLPPTDAAPATFEDQLGSGRFDELVRDGERSLEIPFEPFGAIALRRIRKRAA